MKNIWFETLTMVAVLVPLYFIVDTVFYKKEVINDINNPYDITIRILDENQTIVLKDTTIKLGESINLHCLKYNKNYIVQVMI